MLKAESTLFLNPKLTTATDHSFGICPSTPRQAQGRQAQGDRFVIWNFLSYVLRPSAARCRRSFSVGAQRLADGDACSHKSSLNTHYSNGIT